MKQEFITSSMQKKAMANMDFQFEYLMGIVVVVLLTVVIGASMFSYLGQGQQTCVANPNNLSLPIQNCSVYGSYGLSNSTANPSVPAWMPPVLIVIVGICLLIGVLKQVGLFEK